MYWNVFCFHCSYINVKKIILIIKIIYYILYCYRVQIIDDNIDCVEDGDIFNGNNIVGFDPVDEFAPQIVGVVDERPENVKTLDMYKNKKRWKRVGEDSDNEDSSVINVDQIKNYVQQINKSTLNDLIKKVLVINLNISKVIF